MGYKERDFWRFFRSVKLTIILLVVMAIFALIGTLIPQREEAARVVQFWNPKIMEIFFRLGLFDLYHSLVFRLLLLGLAINIVVCSLDRLPKSIKLATHSLGPAPDTVFERPIVALRAKEMEPKVFMEKLKKALRLFGGKVQIADLGNRIYGHSEYGRSSYFGVYVVHLSVLVILIGGLIGSIWGFEGYVNILEGDVIDTVELRDGKSVLKLGYSIRCDEFRADFYPNGTPKEFRSRLTILNDGEELFVRDVLVNHPMEIDGIRFYQASYGTILYGAIFRFLKGDQIIGEAELKKEMQQTLPNGLKVELKDLREDFMGRLGPAFLLRLEGEGLDEKEIWVFKRPELLKMIPQEMKASPRLDPSTILPYKVELKEVIERQYTGLQVSKDPGVNVVWIGCFMMILGFFLTFFYSHRQLWIRLEWDKTPRLLVAARTNRDHAGLEHRVSKVLDYIRREIAEREEI